MHIECTKNSGKPYLRIVEGKYTNENGKIKNKNKEKCSKKSWPTFKI